MKKNWVPRVLLSLLGVALILLGGSQIALGYLGESATAVLTSVRREGGERDESVAGRYTYSIGYTFSTTDGKRIDGHSRKIGGAVFLRADGISTVRVRYFRAFPYYSVMESDAGLGLGQLALIVVGGVLIYLMNGREKRRR